ncbi:hypothetical protein LY78DRAFT_204800 [Colletotrichum sublineola]|nr:hypothetical protein LY78DRAFT_204800 [Colletotrichum sublineola]
MICFCFFCAKASSSRCRKPKKVCHNASDWNLCGRIHEGTFWRRYPPGMFILVFFFCFFCHAGAASNHPHELVCFS